MQRYNAARGSAHLSRKLVARATSSAGNLIEIVPAMADVRREGVLLRR